MSNTRYALSNLNYNEFNPKLMYLSYAIFEKDWASKLHSHNFSEFIFVTGGTGGFIFNETSFPLKKGSLAIANPNTIHTEVSSAENPLEYIILGVDKLRFKHLDMYISEDLSSPPHGFNPVFDLADHYDQIYTKLSRLKNELEQKDELFTIMAQSLLKIIIIDIVRFTKLIANHSKAPKMSSECSLIQHYIDANFSLDISLDELSKKFYVSKYQLIHIFKKYLGTSPIGYIISRRLEEGKNLLENTTLTISDICKEVGFSSTGHFTEAFKKVYGLAPSKYRQEYNQRMLNPEGASNKEFFINNNTDKF